MVELECCSKVEKGWRVEEERGSKGEVVRGESEREERERLV